MDVDKTVKETPRPCPACGKGFTGPAHVGCSKTAATVIMGGGAGGPSTLDEIPAEAKPFDGDPTRELNQYLLVKELGKGGMGEVWKAWDRKLTRWVAVKFLLGCSEEGVARFKREAKLAARLSHPNIAPIHEVGEAPSRQPGKPVIHFIAMEYIDGTSLAQAKMPPRDLVDLFVKVAQGVERAHKGGVIHRDLKPANVMLTREHWPYVMDFGLARPLEGDSGLSATGAVMGTPAYMPPEQVEGKLEELGPESDVYSLGATMYAVFCGTQPFVAQTTMQVLRKVCAEAPVPPRQHAPGLPADLEAVILKAMAKAKKDRHPSAAALAEDLKKVLARIDAGAPAPATVPPPPAPAPSSSALPLLVGIALVCLLLASAVGAGAWYLIFKPKDGSPTASNPNPAPPLRPAPTPPPSPVPPLVPVPTPAPAPSPVPTPAPSPVPSPVPVPVPSPVPVPVPIPVPAFVPPSAKPAAEAGLAGAGLTAQRIDDSIRKAGRFLATRYADRDFEGADGALATFALLHTPAYVEDPALAVKIARFLRSVSPTVSPREQALRALALEAAGDPVLRPLAAQSAQYLVEAQGARGLWPETAAVDVPGETWGPAAVVVLGGRPLDVPPARAIARKGAPAAVEGDPASTELALLGLGAAARAGARAPREIWTNAARGLEATRNRATGGWDGQGASGYAALALAGGGSDPAAAFRAAEAFDARPTVLCSLERGGAALKTPFVHEIEWYPAGAKALIDVQGPDGSWTEKKTNATAATASGILFLAKATSRAAEPPPAGLGALETRALGGAPNLYFMLDASGWMRQELDGRERFDVAKEIIGKVAETLPAGAWFGLRVFGARRGATDPAADIDTQLAIPPAPVEARRVKTHLDTLRVKGKSPLTLSLVEAAKDLAAVPPTVEMTAVLFIDGRDSDRKADPVVGATELAASRKGMPVHIVGFNVDDDEIQARLARMAEATGGRYVKASDAKALFQDVLGAVKRSDAYAVLDVDGKEVARGVLGDRRELPAGRYGFVYGAGLSRGERSIWVNPGLPTLVVVDALTK